MSVILSVIWFVDIAANCLAFIMHILGIFAILNCRRKTNQLFILLNLSLIEAFATVYSVANDLYREAKYGNKLFNSSEIMEAALVNKLPPVYQEISFTVYYATAIELVLICLILTLDRLVSVQYPFKYKAYVTRHKLKVILIATWCVSGVMGVLYGVFPFTIKVLVLIFLFIAFLYLILAVITYSLILHKIRHPLRTVSSNSKNETVHKVRFKKQYMIPALIIATYFLFYAIPSLIQRFWIRSNELTYYKFILHECLSILLDIGLICDAVTYVFLTKYLRQIICRQFCRCFTDAVVIDETSVSETKEKRKKPSRIIGSKDPKETCI